MESWNDMTREIRAHLENVILPFWKGLRDEQNGGYAGYVGYDLTRDFGAVKGCILNSRILWFFSRFYRSFRKNPAFISVLVILVQYKNLASENNHAPTACCLSHCNSSCDIY